MNLDLTDEETATLAAFLRRAIRDDRYPLSPRVKSWQSILDKIEPPPKREPLPPPLPTCSLLFGARNAGISLAGSGSRCCAPADQCALPSPRRRGPACQASG